MCSSSLLKGTEQEDPEEDRKVRRSLPCVYKKYAMERKRHGKRGAWGGGSGELLPCKREDPSSNL